MGPTPPLVRPTLHIWMDGRTDIQTDGDYIKRVVRGVLQFWQDFDRTVFIVMQTKVNRLTQIVMQCCQETMKALCNTKPKQ